MEGIYAIHSTKNWDKFEVIDFEPKRFDDYDIDIQIEYCAVCASDVHTITGGWGDPILPLIPSHEIVGHIVRVGPKVTTFKVGDRAGVGAQVYSCFNCAPCNTDDEQYCLQGVDTYNDRYPNGDIAQGGYATAMRPHERYVMPLPKEISLEEIAPMLCAGATVYSPLVRNGAGPGQCIGVIGIGGLGHLAIQFARALGAEHVVAFTRSQKKEKDARDLGATEVVATENEGFAEHWARKFDLILCTASVSKIPLSDIMRTLGVHGRLIIVSRPDEPLPPLDAANMHFNGAFLGGSHIASKKEIIEMLDLAATKGVRCYIEVLPMKDAGKAVRNIENDHVRFKHVLKVDI